MAICWPYPFTLPKFLQALRILLTSPESYYGMILDCDIPVWPYVWQIMCCICWHWVFFACVVLQKNLKSNFKKPLCYSTLKPIHSNELKEYLSCSRWVWVIRCQLINQLNQWRNPVRPLGWASRQAGQPQLQLGNLFEADARLPSAWTWKGGTALVALLAIRPLFSQPYAIASSDLQNICHNYWLHTVWGWADTWQPISPQLPLWLPLYPPEAW